MSRPPGAHLPIVVNEKRQKLSKRRDKVALEAFRDEGYLARGDAQLPHAARLGAARRPRDRAVGQMVAEFRIEDVNPSPAFFDVKKLRAFNGEYIRALSPEDSSRPCQPWLEPPLAPWPAERFDPAVFAELAPLAQTRVALLSEITAMVDFAFLAEPVYDEASWAKAMKEPAAEMLAEVAAAYARRPLGARRAARAAGGSRGELRAVAGQGAGAGPGRGDRPDCRPAAVRVAGGAGPGGDPAPDRVGARAGDRAGVARNLSRRPACGPAG